MARLFQYVGAKAIADLQVNKPAGILVCSPADVIRWRDMSDQEVCGPNEYVATFTVDEKNRLRIAHRRSEHVACSGRSPVLSAGEIAFTIVKDVVEVTWVTNQSTGYCPEPKSWPAVKFALLNAGIDPPDEFTWNFDFRRCEQCQTINVVKANLFECEVCGSELSQEWNFQDKSGCDLGKHDGGSNCYP